MYRRLSALILFPLLLGQQCIQPAVDVTGDLTPSESPRVTLQTSRGNIVIELFTQQGQAAALFKSYVEEGYYNDAIFHEAQNGKWIIGGLYRDDLKLKEARTLVDESDNGLTHFRGRVAMANPVGDDNNRSAAILINLTTNESLDYDGADGALYTVIGRVAQGMDVVDKIASLNTQTQTTANGLTLSYLPTQPVYMDNATVVDDDDDDTDEFITTASGLKYRDEVIGEGELVTLDMTLQVLYTGRLNDENGEIFDENIDRENPSEFPLTNLIQGWQEGLSQYGMRVGGRRILIIPPDLGYGDQDRPSIPANSTLYFDVEVLPGENDPPEAVVDADRTVVSGLEVMLNAFDSTDPDGDSLNFSWTQDSGEPVELAHSGTSVPTFIVPETTDSLVFTVTVDDGNGETDSATITLTVTNEPNVRLETSMGDIVLDMLNGEDEAPNTALNFLQYVEDDFYDGTIFHRVVENYVVQAGKYLPDLIEQAGKRDSIENEFSADRSNLRGTVAMFKDSEDPHSATSEFFINLADNSEFFDDDHGGFTVFAEVSEGMDIVDAMAEVEISEQNDPDGNTFYGVPVEDIILISATIE